MCIWRIIYDWLGSLHILKNTCTKSLAIDWRWSLFLWNQNIVIISIGIKHCPFKLLKVYARNIKDRNDNAKVYIFFNCIPRIWYRLPKGEITNKFSILPIFTDIWAIWRYIMQIFIMYKKKMNQICLHVRRGAWRAWCACRWSYERTWGLDRPKLFWTSFWV